MNFEEKLIERLKRIEREVERLRVWERPAGGSGVTDHGALTGLSDNDHPQYLLTTGKAADSDKLDGIDSTGFVKTSGNQTVGGIKTFTSIPALPATDPTTANQAVRKGFADATYLGISAKASDSDKLDGLDSTAFVQTSVLGVWQDWTPAVTGWAAGYTVNTARYKLIGKTCFFTVDISGTSNSSANITITMPFTSYSGAGDPVWGGTNAYQVDNGVASTTPGRWSIGENSGTLYAVKDMATGAWTASGAKRIRITGFYEIA